MKREPHNLTETRSQLIARHVRAALNATGLPIRSFASRVADRYLATVPREARVVTWHVGTTVDDAERANKANAQLLWRYLDGTVKVLPADLEESIVLALPEPFCSAAKSDLAARYGLLAAPQPAADGEHAQQTVSIADMLREQGELFAALAPMFADGRIDSADRPHAATAMREIGDVMAKLVGLQQQIIAACGIGAPA